MPLPVILGIPLLAGIIGGLFTSFFTYLAKFFTKKIAVAIAVIAVIISLTTAFIALISGMMAAISVVTPPYVSLAMSLVVPNNATACVSAIITARLAHWAYAWNVRIIQYKLF